MKNLTIPAVLLLLIASSSYANTYYVRIDGGTKTQCTGLADAAYPGSGTNQACAVAHPFWLGTLDGNNGGTPLFAGGDTIVIKQGSYAIGLGSPNTGSCSSSWDYGCTMPSIPGGSSGNPTKIVGCSTEGCGEGAKPELHATNHAYFILSTGGHDYITLQDLELTQHDICEAGGSNPPVSCSDKTGSGNFGIYGTGSGHITLEGMLIHRMATTGIMAGGVNDWTLNNTTIRANGFVGWNGDSGASPGFTGNFVLNNSKIEYNGCSETYPDNVITHCWGQNGIDPHNGQERGGYGDGVGFGDGTIGNWTITNSSISHNTSDGFDGLHGTGVGDSVYVNRSRFEGNAGQQIKITAPFEMDNSIVIGDCSYFVGKSFDYGVAHCRALGDVIYLGLVPDQSYKIYNSTMVAGGNVMLLTGGQTCNINTKVYLKNNIWLGGYDWAQDPANVPGGDGRRTAFYFAAGADGNGSGTCGTLTPSQDYDAVYGFKNNSEGCSGTHSKCNTNPGLANTILLGPAATGYTTTENLYQQVTLGAGSVAIGAADPSVSLLFPSNDYTGAARGAVWDMGAYEYGSVPDSDPDPVCDASHLNLCTSGNCSGAGGYWYGSQCNQNPEAQAGSGFRMTRMRFAQ